MYIFIGNLSISEKNAYEDPFVNFEKIKSSVKLWIINFKIKWVIGAWMWWSLFNSHWHSKEVDS